MRTHLETYRGYDIEHVHFYNPSGRELHSLEVMTQDGLYDIKHHFHSVDDLERTLEAVYERIDECIDYEIEEIRTEVFLIERQRQHERENHLLQRL